MWNYNIEFGFRNRVLRPGQAAQSHGGITGVLIDDDLDGIELDTISSTGMLGSRGYPQFELSFGGAGAMLFRWISKTPISDLEQDPYVLIIFTVRLDGCVHGEILDLTKAGMDSMDMFRDYEDDDSPQARQAERQAALDHYVLEGWSRIDSTVEILEITVRNLSVSLTFENKRAGMSGGNVVGYITARLKD
jgi:hypothetical protein